MPFQVTPEFLKSLKKATQVYMYSEDGKNVSIRLTTKVREARYSRKMVEQDTVFTFTFDYASVPFRFLSMYKDISGWSALALIVKAGDELRFHTLDNSNGYLKRATTSVSDSAPVLQGLHNDCLNVSVTRKGKLVLQQLTLESGIAPDNSARCIDPQGLWSA